MNFRSRRDLGGHSLNTGRTSDDYLPRKFLKDLYYAHSDSIINDRDAIKSFCTKYDVDEKHVITYVNHLEGY